MLYLLPLHKSLLPKKKFLCLYKLSLPKELSKIIFNFPVSSFTLFLLELPPIFIVWVAYVFVFAALSISGFVGFGFVLRVFSPYIDRLPVTRL